MKKIASFRRSKSQESSGQNTLPRKPEVKVTERDYHHATVPRVASSSGNKQRPSLSNLINIGKDDLRTSIDALDRVLDEFDDESGISQGSDESLRKRNNNQTPAAGSTAEQAARMIAAQLSDGKATLRLKKTKFSQNLEDEDLPPPPPELLQSNDRPNLLNVQCNTPTQKQTTQELYARHKRPPAVPRRSPQTKITTTELQPREVGHADGAFPPPDYEDDEQAPESGYITPEQQSSELEYPVPSQQKVTQAIQYSPSGSVSSNQSTPQHISQSYTTTVQAEVHVSCPQDNRNSLASIGSVPSMPPPPPPEDAMALQVNPIHRTSGKHISVMSASSGSSSGTLHDPYQPEDLYQHYIAPSDNANSAMHRPSYDGLMPSVITPSVATESNAYEMTLPASSVQTVPKRPLPTPPVGQEQYNRMNGVSNPGAAATMPNQRRFVSPTSPMLEAFPPPPPQFAGNEASTSPQHHFASKTVPRPSAYPQSSPDSSPTKNALPFPVKLRPTGSTLLKDGNNEASVYQYKDSIDVFSVVVPPPSCQSKGAAPSIMPKSRPTEQPSGSAIPSSLSSVIPPTSSPQFPAPPSPISPHNYAEITTEQVLPPPPPLPPGGISADLANRIQEWSITNQDRPSRPGRSQTVDAHTALLNQIQTGIKLRKSPFSNKLFDTSHRDDPVTQQTPHVVGTYPQPDYVYADSIETCSTISGESSSSGCHSNSSYSNSTTSSPPPQTLPKPRKQITDVTQLPGYQPVPSNCPAWKANLIEKKNQQLEEEARRKLIAQREEENRWKDIPEWKRNLILEKEKRKVAPLEAERRKHEEEMAKLQAMPGWKRDLILKKRGDQ